MLRSADVQPLFRDLCIRLREQAECQSPPPFHTPPSPQVLSQFCGRHGAILPMFACCAAAGPWTLSTGLLAFRIATSRLSLLNNQPFFLSKSSAPITTFFFSKSSAPAPCCPMLPRVYGLAVCFPFAVPRPAPRDAVCGLLPRRAPRGCPVSPSAVYGLLPPLLCPVALQGLRSAVCCPVAPQGLRPVRRPVALCRPLLYTVCFPLCCAPSRSKGCGLRSAAPSRSKGCVLCVALLPCVALCGIRSKGCGLQSVAPLCCCVVPRRVHMHPVRRPASPSKVCGLLPPVLCPVALQGLLLPAHAPCVALCCPVSSAIWPCTAVCCLPMLAVCGLLPPCVVVLCLVACTCTLCVALRRPPKYAVCFPLCCAPSRSKGCCCLHMPPVSLCVALCRLPYAAPCTVALSRSKGCCSLHIHHVWHPVSPSAVCCLPMLPVPCPVSSAVCCLRRGAPRSAVQVTLLNNQPIFSLSPRQPTIFFTKSSAASCIWMSLSTSFLSKSSAASCIWMSLSTSKFEVAFEVAFRGRIRGRIRMSLSKLDRRRLPPPLSNLDRPLCLSPGSLLCPGSFGTSRLACYILVLLLHPGYLHARFPKTTKSKTARSQLHATHSPYSLLLSALLATIKPTTYLLMYCSSPPPLLLSHPCQTAPNLIHLLCAYPSHCRRLH